MSRRDRAHRVARFARRAAVLALVAVGGCANERTPDTFDAASRQAADTRQLTWLLIALATLVVVIVGIAIVHAALVGRRRLPGDAAGTRFITVAGVVLPSVLLAIAGVATVVTTNATRPAGAAADALVVRVTGHQWWWEIAYPASGVRTANEIHIPVDQPVIFEITSADVIHSLWVPQLGGKLDAIPGVVNRLPVHATRVAELFGACAEYCGLQHAHMGLIVHVDTRADFESWLGTGRAAIDRDARGRAVYESLPCAGCHRIAGTASVGVAGPDLTDLGARRTIGAGALPNDPSSLASWIANPSAAKPGVHMPGFPVPPDDMAALVAYLEGPR